MSLRKKLQTVKSPSDLSDAEYKILQDQGQLPAGFPIRSEFQGPPEVAVTFQGHTGTVATMSTEELEAELERRRAEQTSPSIGDKGGIQEDDEDLAYEDMSNDDLRAELASRDLAVSGSKADLIARLEEDDASESDD